MTQCPTPQKKATKLFLFSTTPFPPSSLLLLGWWMFWNIAGLNCRGKLKRAKPGLRPQAEKCTTSSGTTLRVSHEDQCSPATGGKAAQLKIWLRTLDRPHWSKAWMFCKLWYSVHRAFEYTTEFPAGSNLAEPSFIPVWILQIHHVSKNPYFLSFSLSNALPPFFMLLTRTSKIMHLIKSIHLKTLEADWQAMSVSYSVNLRTIPGAH